MRRMARRTIALAAAYALALQAIFALSVAASLAASPVALVATAASAHAYAVGSLKINHPWSRATPKGASVAGGYMKITNNGTTPDRLTGGTTDAAQKFEIHEMSMEGGVMKMRELQ